MTKRLRGYAAFLSKFVNVLTKTQDLQLGYQLDSRYYGILASPSCTVNRAGKVDPGGRQPRDSKKTCERRI